jgi:hypothetical protein
VILASPRDDLVCGPFTKVRTIKPMSPEFAESGKPLLPPIGPLDSPADRLVPDGPSVASPGRDGPPDLADGEPAHAGPDGPLAGYRPFSEHLDGAAQLELVRAELERQGKELRPTVTGGFSSSCPALPSRIHPWGFEARIAADGSLELHCDGCDHTHEEHLTALFDHERFVDELHESWSREFVEPAPEGPADDRAFTPAGEVATQDEFIDRTAGFEDFFRGIPLRAEGLPVAEFEPGDVHQLLWENDRGDSDGQPDEMASILRMIDLYPIMDLGGRPVDYRVRDMMHGSCFRNRRLQRFSRTSRDPEEWQIARTAHLPGGMRIQARQHLALRRDHLGGLYRLTTELPEELENMEGLGHIERLAECPPYGVLLEGEGKNLVRRICRHKRLCPWCLARWSDDLYGRLMRGPCRPADGSGKAWVMGRLHLPGREDGEELDAAEVSAVRRRWGGALIRWAFEQLGAVGGVVVHQIGPPRELSSEIRFLSLSHCISEPVLPPYWYEHDLAIVCEVPFGTEEQRERLWDGIGTTTIWSGRRSSTTTIRSHAYRSASRRPWATTRRVCATCGSAPRAIQTCVLRGSS